MVADNDYSLKGKRQNWSRQELDSLVEAIFTNDVSAVNDTNDAIEYLKCKGFKRNTAQIQRKKAELIKSFELIKPYFNLLDTYLKKVENKTETAETTVGQATPPEQVSNESTPDTVNQTPLKTTIQVAVNSDTEARRPHVREKHDKRQRQNQKPKHKNRNDTNVCKFFLTGECRHGTEGTGCRFPHPKGYRINPNTNVKKYPQQQKQTLRQRSYADAVHTQKSRIPLDAVARAAREQSAFLEMAQRIVRELGWIKHAYTQSQHTHYQGQHQQNLDLHWPPLRQTQQSHQY